MKKSLMKSIMTTIIASMGIVALFPVGAGAQWVHLTRPDGGDLTCALLAKDGNLFISSSLKLYRSTDSGISWKVIKDSILCYSLAAYGADLLAGSTTDGILRSTDNGTSWSSINNGLPSMDITAIFVSPTYFLAGTTNGDWHPIQPICGISRSSDYGTNWTLVNPAVLWPTNMCIHFTCDTMYIPFNSFATLGNYCFTGSDSIPSNGCLLYYSTDSGINWSSRLVSSSGQGIKSIIVVNDSVVFAGIYGSGVYRSNDSGMNWTRVDSGLTNINIKSLFHIGPHLFAGTWGGGVFHSSDMGGSWNEFNSGLTDMYITSFTVDSSYFYVGTGRDVTSHSAWRRPLSDVSVKHPQNSLPEQFSFNLLTHNRSNLTISFSLPRADKVMVKIYNLSGHLIATLLDKPMAAGPHTVSWDTRNVASGCYMVRMQAGPNSQVKAVPLFR